MANFKRNKPRLRTSNRILSMSSWPSFHDRSMNRRKRRLTARMVHQIERGVVDADNAALPVSGARPHIYWW